MFPDMDWYHDTESHLFDDVERAADAAAEEVLDEDRALAAMEIPMGLDPRRNDATEES